MARKTSRKGTEEVVIAAAMALAGEQGWAAVTLVGIAERAKLPVIDLIRQYPSKHAMLAALSERVDEAMLADVPKRYEDLGDGPRDRLFELLMARIDALAPYKAGIAAILGGPAASPLEIACLLPRLGQSMALTLELAGISSSGVSGALRIKGLLVAYGDALRAWLDDDSQDLIRTMATLDRNLRRAEKLASLFWPRAKGAPAGDETAAGG